MKCRQCRHPDTKVLESRESRDGYSVRRRRECSACSYRFTTFERQEEQPVSVIKRDATRELFSRQKLVQSMAIACQKREVNLKELDAIADWVERSGQGTEDREITTVQIGELVLEALRHLDAVAYVRFASVYRKFSGPEDFAEVLRQIAEKTDIQLPDELLTR